MPGNEVNCVYRTKSSQLRGVHYPLVHIHLAHKSIWLSHVDGGVALHMPADTTWTYGKNVYIHAVLYMWRQREKADIYMAKWESDPTSRLSAASRRTTQRNYLSFHFTRSALFTFDTQTSGRHYKDTYTLRPDLKSRTTSCRRPYAAEVILMETVK